MKLVKILVLGLVLNSSFALAEFSDWYQTQDGQAWQRGKTQTDGSVLWEVDYDGDRVADESQLVLSAPGVHEMRIINSYANNVIIYELAGRPVFRFWSDRPDGVHNAYCASDEDQSCVTEFRSFGAQCDLEKRSTVMNKAYGNFMKNRSNPDQLKRKMYFEAYQSSQKAFSLCKTQQLAGR